MFTILITSILNQIIIPLSNKKSIAGIAALLLLTFVHPLFAQHSEPREIRAFKIEEKLKLDGQLTEAVWDEAMYITNFTQRDLDYGQPATEKTKAAILYDNNTMYVGIWCYQKDVSKIVAKNMSRDFDYETDDNFQILISPFNDSRNGYLFVINPNGARADIQVYNGEDGNMDWNGVWDVKTTITDEGWFAEVNIPFSTLQFKRDRVLNWAINFERDIVAENEQALWQGWSRDNTIFAVNNAGLVTGIKDISYAKKFELKPYGLAGWRYSEDDGKSFPFKFGANLNVSLSPTLKLNLTSFTDFAQVEADRIPVNLSRFSVFYPEKRQFFLDGYDLYNFYLGDRNYAFYSRQIGVEDGKQVPIIAGARLFGKIGKSSIGFLNIQEGKADSVSATNNTVMRYKHDIGKQSYIGGIFTNKINNTTSNQVVGLDAVYQTSSFLKDKNLIISATATTSLENFTVQDNAMNYRIFIDYPNDLIDNYMSIAGMQKNYNPELGYVRRVDYNSYAWHLRIAPRVFTKYGVKRLLLKPWGLSLYKTQSTGELESFYNETRPLGAVFQSGERFEINAIQNYERLDDPLELTDGISIAEGKYWMFNYELQFETYQARKIWIELLYNWGDFYDGRIKTIESVLGININKHMNINVEYTMNIINFSKDEVDIAVTTNELALYLNYAFNTKLNLSLFTQYNDLDELMFYNIRLHWIPKVGSDLYFVYNIGYEEQIRRIEYIKPTTTDAALKLVYRIVF